VIKLEDIQLKEGCGACPEDYEAYLNGKQVGYLRLRWGTYRVFYKDFGEMLVYYAYPKGHGVFYPDEREYYLDNGKKALIDYLNNNPEELKKYESQN
jgi:hypothetical protein